MCYVLISQANQVPISWTSQVLISWTVRFQLAGHSRFQLAGKLYFNQLVIAELLGGNQLGSQVPFWQIHQVLISWAIRFHSDGQILFLQVNYIFMISNDIFYQLKVVFTTTSRLKNIFVMKAQYFKPYVLSTYMNFAQKLHSFLNRYNLQIFEIRSLEAPRCCTTNRKTSKRDSHFHYMQERSHALL